MSIANIPENTSTFSGGNNIRIAIAGLAICKFGAYDSTIRFLRHVDRHKLKMKITQKNASDMNLIGVRDYMLGESLRTIKIEGAERLASADGFTYKPTNYQEHELKTLLDLTFLHGHKLSDKPTGLPNKLPTSLRIYNCLFYTAKMTDNEFDLTKDNLTIKLKKKFGEILGGYMKVDVANKLTITIDDLFESPIELPMKNSTGTVKYLYEINFNNACFDENDMPCKAEKSTSTDFKFIYDILEDNVSPKEKFDLKPLKLREEIKESKSEEYTEILSLNTGACLPVAEEPCLNYD